MLMARHAEVACAAKADGDVGDNVDEAAMDACATTKKCLGILSTQGDQAVPTLAPATSSAIAAARSA